MRSRIAVGPDGITGDQESGMEVAEGGNVWFMDELVDGHGRIELLHVETHSRKISVVGDGHA